MVHMRQEDSPSACQPVPVGLPVEAEVLLVIYLGMTVSVVSSYCNLLEYPPAMDVRLLVQSIY